MFCDTSDGAEICVAVVGVTKADDGAENDETIVVGAVLVG